MLRLASLMRSAISRRTPMTLISEVCAAGTAAGAAAVGRGAAWASAPQRRRAGAAIRSSRRMRPPGPEPATRRKIDAGLARAAPVGRRGHDPAGAQARPLASAAPRHSWQLARRVAGGVAAAAASGAGGWRRRRRGIGLEHDQRRTHRHLVARRAGDRQHPAADRRGHFHGRLVGHHFDDDLILGHDGARRRVCQATISASTVPSPRSGILNTNWLMPTPSRP